ncbi:helix-turn-helix domain-containing protein [Pedobacter kyonggii]|uniref:Helix-turn-helix domain-containing protein n=1 Tax=Pedobacter kyonggii TaxID=1926871 RepID=A0A4Q9H9G4_9SPHI|nr:helix-turn-helix domain-containing protein [Pedobacter kyonggii]
MLVLKKATVGKSVLKIQRAEADEIKKILNKNEAYTVGARLNIVYLVALGHSSRKLSELHNISFKQITNWAHRFENEGIEGLKDKKGRGRHSALSNEQLERIKTVVLKQAPSDYGLESNRWTGPTLAKWINQEYGLAYQKAQVYNLLEKVGVTFKKKQGLTNNV